MSKKQWVYFIFFVVLLGAFFLLQKGWYRRRSQLPTPIQLKDSSYFCPIAVSKYTLSNHPCLLLNIGEKQFSSVLDLGFSGDLSVLKEPLEQLKDKRYVGQKEMYGLQGTRFEKRSYEIPEVRIGPIIFLQREAQEESSDFHQESAVIITEKTLPEPVRIGWKLFENTNLLLDLKHSRIALANNLSTLEKNGYPSDKFLEMPFFTDTGLIEIWADTSEGKLACVIDTASTWNVLRQEDNTATDIFTYSNFELGGKDIGPISFHKLAIGAPFPMQALLGMEFFEEHVVFLDFSRKRIYIAKAEM